MNRTGTLVSSSDLVPLDVAVDVACVAAATHDVRFAIAGRTLAVRFDDREAAALFERRYRAMRSSATPEMTTTCMRRGDDYVFLRSDGTNRMWRGEPLHPSTVAFFADAVAVNGFFAASRDVLSVHAAGIVAGGRVALLSGISTAGKTTTAVAALLAGAALTSDERVVLRGGLVLPFTRAISLRAGGCALLAEEVAERDDAFAAELRRRAARGEGWPDLGLDDAGAASPPAAPLGAVVLLDGFGAEARLTPIPMRVALAELASAIVSGASGLERAAALRRATHDVPAFRLTLGRPGTSATLLVERLLAGAVAA